jgi:hypothetical protein
MLFDRVWEFSMSLDVNSDNLPLNAYADQIDRLERGSERDSKGQKGAGRAVCGLQSTILGAGTGSARKHYYFVVRDSTV